MTPMKAKPWRLTTLAVAMGIGIAAMNSSASAQSDRIVNFYGWANYISPDVLAEFKRETGISVRYDTFDTNDILEAKLLLGKSGYDVVVPTAYFVQRLIRAGVLRRLDKSRLPNLVHLWPDIASRLAAYDPGNAFAVNYMWGTTGIGYDATQAEKILGAGKSISSWKTVFQPQELAKFKNCGVEMVDSVDDILTAALNYLGLEPNSIKLADLERAAGVVRAIRPSVRRFNSSEYVNTLAAGEVCLVVGWSGDIKQAQMAAADARSRVDIRYVIPDDRAQIWLDNLAIAKDAPHVDEAYALIDFLQRPEIAAKNTNLTRNANGNLASQKFIDPAIIGDPTIYPPPQVMKNLYTVNAREPAVQRSLLRTWQRLKLGQ
jgi:putrescine transport system substrate-binding protein